MRRALFLGSVILLGCSGGDGGMVGDDSGTTSPDGSMMMMPGMDATPMQDSSMMPDTGPVLCGGKICGPNEVCLADTACVCNIGYVPGANGCDPAPMGSPASHTEMQVCQKWKDGHVVTAPMPFTKGSNNCDLGTFSAGGMTDTLKRINMFRWMEGLADVTDNSTRNTGAQSCAVIQAWNNPGNFMNPHNPPSNATCYTSLGGMWCGQSNLAWGTSSADSIDLYVRDPGSGNATSIGHRRWVIHPKLGQVGVGYYEGGNNGYGGRAQALAVFDTSGSGPMPAWYAFPPPGFVPLPITPGVLNVGWAWTFHLVQKSVVSGAMITVRDLGAAKDLAVTVKTLNQGYGDDAISFYPNGWTPAANAIYRVTVVVPMSGTYVYDIRPVTCQ